MIARHPPAPTRPGEAIVFADHPEFRPNLTPRQIFRLGSFGGTYWRKIYSGVTSREYHDQHAEFADLDTTDFDDMGAPYVTKWWAGIPNDHLTSGMCDPRRNMYGVTSGTSLVYWESHGWIIPQDPYGWVQWYCRFYTGRRSDDDERQIKRWLAFAGPSGRFRKRLISMVHATRPHHHDDRAVSPVIRQGLQQWAYVLTAADARRG